MTHPANGTMREACTTVARAKFRRYWVFVSPGAILIRLLALRQVILEGEKRSKAIPLVVNYVLLWLKNIRLVQQVL